MAISPISIALGAVTLLLPVDAFVPPRFLSSVSLEVKTSLSYGPRDVVDRDEENEIASPSSQFNYYQNPAPPADEAYCSAEDEDCLAFSSLDDYNDNSLVFNSNNNDDPLCDPQDVDCLAFLPKTYLSSDTYLAAELRTRSNSIDKERTDHNWRTANCPTTFVSISNSDWVRRVHMETYPLAVCGGARGGIYVVNLEEQSIIGQVEGAHIVQVKQQDSSKSMAKQAMEKLYGKLDGGGVVAVAIHGDLIASSGREGGVKLWRIERSTGQLVPLGSVGALQNTVVTTLKFDSNDLLWTACYDGTVHAYSTYGLDDIDFSMSDQLPSAPVFQSDFTDSVLDMHLCEELKLGVCATADGGAALFNMDDGQFFVGIMLFEVAARSVTIVKHKHDDAGYSVLCGGADGVIHRIPLNVNPATGRVDEENPFGVSETTDTAIKPRHVGPVMCMTSPDDGVFISGGQDGALRVWDCAEGEAANDAANADIADQQQAEEQLQTKCMYALTGYKLWLGSACTDGKRLLSDGGENSIIMRDFSC